MTSRLDKEGSGRRWLELRILVNTWDPSGLIAAGAPIDEYDCMVGPIMRLLESGTPAEEIGVYLDHELVDHFGESPRDFGSRSFAEKAVGWFDERWKGTRV